MAISPETALSLSLPVTPMWIAGTLPIGVSASPALTNSRLPISLAPCSSDGEAPFFHQTHILAHLHQNLPLAEFRLEIP